MADADNVMGELINNGDTYVVYDGATDASGKPLFPNAGLNTGSLRYGLKQIIWDLLRFQKLANPFFGAPFDPNVGYGMRDMVTRSLKVAEENNALLKAIAAKVGVDPTSLGS